MVPLYIYIYELPELSHRKGDSTDYNGFFTFFIAYDVSFVVEKDLLQFIEYLPSVQSLSVAVLRSMNLNVSFFIFSYFLK